jgi:hypothetical protein
LARYGQERALAAEDLRELTLYHLSQGAVRARSFSRRLLDAWVEQSPQDIQARWIRVRVEQLQGNVAAVIHALHVLLETDPRGPEYLEAAAETYLQLYVNRRSVVMRADPAAALAPLRKLLGVTRDSRAVIYQKMAQTYAAAGDMASALKRLEEGATESTKNRKILEGQNL